MPIFVHSWAIPVRSHVWKFGSDWLSLSRVIVARLKKITPAQGGGGGLHLTCDTHFQTQLTYSSQKSCVKIWFGLVEIGSMLIFMKGGGGGLHATCDTHFCTQLSISSQKSSVKIWFGLGEPFKSIRGNNQKKKSQTILKTICFRKFFSGA